MLLRAMPAFVLIISAISLGFISCKIRSVTEHASTKMAHGESQAQGLNRIAQRDRAEYAAMKVVSDATVILRMDYIEQDGRDSYQVNSRCSGSVIGKNYVLTAAHCFYNKSGNTYNTTTARIEVNGYSYDGKVIWTAPDYGKFMNDMSRQPDLAIVKISGDITNATGGAVVKLAGKGTSLPTPESDEEGYPKNRPAFGWVLGGGITSTSDNETGFIYMREIEIFEKRDPKEIYLSITARGVFSEKRRDIKGGIICSGDSGGPAIIYANGTAVQFGVNSFANKECGRVPHGQTKDVRVYQSEILAQTQNQAQFIEQFSTSNANPTSPKEPPPTDQSNDDFIKIIPEVPVIPRDNSNSQSQCLYGLTGNYALRSGYSSMEEACFDQLPPGRKHAGIRKITFSNSYEYGCMAYGDPAPNHQNDYCPEIAK